MKSVLALGEVLWDLFPEGPRFGGAPANFACACAELGGPHLRVSLSSAVGRDGLGDEARRRLSGHGVDGSHLAVNGHPTGRVFVQAGASGTNDYRFSNDDAWDHIPVTPHLLATAAAADVVCFGTLGQRAAESRETIRAVVNATRPGCLRVLDVNLRATYWSPALLLDSLALANVVKLNDEELPIVARVVGESGGEAAVLERIRDRFDLKLLALTRGASGSRLVAADGITDDRPGEPVDVVNTVGAGDAFTAALALGLVFGHPLARTHAWAADIAAFVCTQPGGTCTFPPQLRLLP